MTETARYIDLDTRGHALPYPVFNLELYNLLKNDETDLISEPIANLAVRWRDCSYCGEYVNVVLHMDPVIATVTTECPSPDGVEMVFRLNVPSGKIVVADSLKDAYNVDLDTVKSLNLAIGCKEYSLAMSEIGCAHGFVGNTSPNLYRVGPDQYQIASWDEELEDQRIALANICTDLWWYSIADYDDYLAKGGEISQFREVVDVPPGVYEFTHHTGKASFKNIYDEGAPDVVVYADIRKVDDV